MRERAQTTSVPLVMTSPSASSVPAANSTGAGAAKISPKEMIVLPRPMMHQMVEL